MKKIVNKRNALFVLCAIVIVVSIARINALENRVEQLSNGVNNMENTLSNQIRNISLGVEESLKTEASIFSSSDYTVGKFDSNTYQLPLTLKVAPKEYKKDTKAIIVCNNVTTEMQFENGYYTGIAVVSPLETQENTVLVVFEDGNKKRGEQIDVRNDFFHQCFPDITAAFMGETMSSTKGGKLEYKIDGNIRVQCNSKPENCEIKSCKLYSEINGKKIMIRDMSKTAELKDIETFGLTYELKKTFKLPAGSLMRLYVVTTDNNGFIYEATASKVKVDKNGNSVDMEDDMPEGQSTIYDKDGKLLYVPHYY